MDRKDLESLKVGDTVQIHFDHPGASGARAEPFNVVVAAIRGMGKAYKEEDGQYYESRQISWRWADMPIELQPDERVRDDVRGLDTAHEHYISAIVAVAPYSVQPQPRNVMYALEQAAFADHLKVEAYRATKRKEGERPFDYWNKKTTATGYVFFTLNETYERDVKKGQFNGHVFSFARAILARRPGVAVSEQIDPDRFMEAWNKAGRPGYVGPFLRMTSRHSWNDDEVEPSKPSVYKALVNRKAFINWVVRNVSRFTMTKDQILKNMIQAADDEEKFMEEDAHRDMVRDLGYDPRSVEAEEDEDDEENDTSSLVDYHNDFSDRYLD